LIEAAFNPEPNLANKVTLTLLSKATFNFDNIQAVIEKVAEIQRLTAFTKNIGELRLGQIAKFNLHSPITHRIKYMLDIADNNQEAVIAKNNCAVFIVPPGLETQFAG
jgi:hypothetical protein